MGKVCKRCGMTSDRDDLCTWCNADLREAQMMEAPPKPRGEPPGAIPPGSAQDQAAAGVPGGATSRRPRRPGLQAAERPPWFIPAVMGAVLIVGTVGALVGVGLVAQKAPPEPGSEWKEFTARDNSFRGYYPAGWPPPSNSGSPESYVQVEWKPSKLCIVCVEGNSKAGAMGDVAAARERAAGGELPVEETADGAMLEWFLKFSFGRHRPGLSQGPMQESYTFASSKAAFAEYTYTKRIGLLPVKMKGERWGSFRGTYGVHAYAEAPEKHWPKFKATAEQIIAAVQWGGGQ